MSRTALSILALALFGQLTACAQPAAAPAAPAASPAAAAAPAPLVAAPLAPAAGVAAAQAAAARRLAAIRLADPDLDPDMSRGLSFAFLVKALARHAVTAWEGIGDAAGKALPLSPEAVERLMDLDDIAAAFWDRATAPVAVVAAEGNG